MLKKRNEDTMFQGEMTEEELINHVKNEAYSNIYANATFLTSVLMIVLKNWFENRVIYIFIPIVAYFACLIYIRYVKRKIEDPSLKYDVNDLMKIANNVGYVGFPVLILGEMIGSGDALLTLFLVIIALVCFFVPLEIRRNKVV